jgi:hypothetical protein
MNNFSGVMADVRGPCIVELFGKLCYTRAPHRRRTLILAIAVMIAPYAIPRLFTDALRFSHEFRHLANRLTGSD